MPLHFRPAAILIAVAATCAAAQEIPPEFRWTATNDVVIQRAFIPSADNRHGEVRLIRRGDVHGVQTLLYSSQMRRGLKAIRNKELAAWPEGQPGAPDSTAYLSLLKQAEEKSLGNVGEDGKARLLIEHLEGPDSGFVALYVPRLGGSGDEIRVESVEAVAASPVSRDYAARAMDLMMESAFKPQPEGDQP